MRHKICGALLAVAMLAGLSGPATADFIFDIGTPNTAIAPYPGPYVHVDIHWVNATTATVTATSLTSGAFTYLMGDGSTFGLNTNGTVSVGAITGAPPTHGTYSTSSGNVSAFGNINFIIDTSDGFPDTSSSLIFTLTNTTGTWADENAVLIANNKGFFGEAHIFVASPNCTNAQGAPIACATGFAGNGSGPPVQETPEPGILSLLGIGLLAAGATALRRRKA
jgi:PEP-CTERM motif